MHTLRSFLMFFSPTRSFQWAHLSALKNTEKQSKTESPPLRSLQLSWTKEKKKKDQQILNKDYDNALHRLPEKTSVIFQVPTAFLISPGLIFLVFQNEAKFDDKHILEKIIHNSERRKKTASPCNIVLKHK